MGQLASGRAGAAFGPRQAQPTRLFPLFSSNRRLVLKFLAEQSHLIHDSNIMDTNMTETKTRNNAEAGANGAVASSGVAAAAGSAVPVAAAGADAGFSPKAVKAAQQGTVTAAPTS